MGAGPWEGRSDACLATEAVRVMAEAQPMAGGEPMEAVVTEATDIEAAPMVGGLHRPITTRRPVANASALSGEVGPGSREEPEVGPSENTMKQAPGAMPWSAG